MGLRGEEAEKYEDWSGRGGGDYSRTKLRGVMGAENDEQGKGPCLDMRMCREDTPTRTDDHASMQT
jgi:hypothetical protein